MRSRKIPSVVIVFGAVLLLVFVYIYFNQFAHVPAEKPQAGATEHVTLTLLPPTPSATLPPPTVANIPLLEVNRATAESEEHYAELLPDCSSAFAIKFNNNIPTLENQDGVVIFCKNDPNVKPSKEVWRSRVNSDNQVEYSPLNMAYIKNVDGAFTLSEPLKSGEQSPGKF